MDNIKKLSSLGIGSELLNKYDKNDKRIDIKTGLNYRQLNKILSENFDNFELIRGGKSKISKMFIYILITNTNYG